MTNHEFKDLIGGIKTLSPEQMLQLHRELESEMAATGHRPATATLTEAEATAQGVQRQLFAAGLLTEIKPPIRDLTPYRDRKPVPIQGEPLSETVIRERR